MIAEKKALEKEQLAAISDSFRECMKDKMDDVKVQEILSTMSSYTTRYNAQCSIASAVFYVFIAPVIEGGKSGEGHGGGLFTPGGGMSWGHVYTNDVERLYRDTFSFEVNAVAAYINVNFFDKDSNLLGHYHGGGVSTVAGIGGGRITWK